MSNNSKDFNCIKANDSVLVERKLKHQFYKALTDTGAEASLVAESVMKGLNIQTAS